ncbi:MAG: histidinol dehydrogenase [Bryobacterales bacterium]|nr:histidinol dehydrogenase [Bryobacterales bacterium]
MLRILRSSDREAVASLFARRSARMGQAEAVAGPILDAVRKRGDAALLEYAKKFDRLEGSTVRVDSQRLETAAAGLSPKFREAVALASAQIREFAELQAPKPWMRETSEGIRLGQIVRPLESVAAYIPGGRYPLPSTLMMTVLPAQVAGVPTVSVCSPGPSAETLGTAGLLGVSNFFHMGGAQAIAAFAFGTETVPKAQRIVGPGNAYVAAAKKMLAGEVGIDFVAGPTEILLIFPDGDPAALAADMLAQAEHDVDAAAILLTTSSELAEQVADEVERQLVGLSTGDVARQAIANNSAIVVTQTVDEACELSNRFAPEHLSIADDSMLDKITNAGSVFIGPWSPEAAGDYASGPNHVLPTSGAAMLRGGLSITDYLKVISVQQLSPEGLQRIAGAVTTLARAEGLEAHARSIEVRIRD